MTRPRTLLLFFGQTEQGGSKHLPRLVGTGAHSHPPHSTPMLGTLAPTAREVGLQRLTAPRPLPRRPPQRSQQTHDVKATKTVSPGQQGNHWWSFLGFRSQTWATRVDRRDSGQCPLLRGPLWAPGTPAGHTSHPQGNRREQHGPILQMGKPRYRLVTLARPQHRGPELGCL